MKKKILATIMSVCMVASLAGCNIFNVMDGDGMVNQNGGQGEDQVQTSSDWDLSLMPDNGGNGEGHGDQDSFAGTKGGIVNDTNNRVLLVIGEDGLLDKTVDYSAIFDPDNGGVIGSAGDCLFFSQYLPGDYERASIRKYNFKTGDMEEIAGGAPSDYFNYYVADDGNTLYHLNIGYDDDYNTVYSCTAYRSENGTWNTGTAEFNTFFGKTATEYDLVWANGSYMTPYTTDGNILVREKEGKRYFFVDSEGNGVSDTIYLCESGSVFGTDGKVIIYYNYGDDYSRSDIMSYNVADGTSRTILTDGSPMVMENGKFFYYTNNDKKVYNSYDVHMYDPITYEDKVLYTKTRSPYFNYSTPGVDFFTVLGNCVYYHDVNNDNNLVWRRLDLNGGAEEDLTVVDENPITKYGKLEVLDKVEYCPECGCVDYTKASAYFVYDGDEASPEVTQKINSTLKDEATGFVENGEEYSLADECEYMHPNYVCTGQTAVTDAWVINNKYLSLETSAYFYYGGAHGGSYTGSYLFDLTTGEQVDVMTLYAGKKEDFAKAVAQKVKEDYNSNESSQYGYFADNADDIYNEAYNCFMDGYCTVLLTDEGAEVVFGEYSLGPYASGQFIYNIGYDKLNFNL